MKKFSLLLAIFVLATILITNIISQSTILSSDALSNEFNESILEKSPKTQDIGFYDWGENNNMTIDSDYGESNETQAVVKDNMGHSMNTIMEANTTASSLGLTEDLDSTERNIVANEVNRQTILSDKIGFGLQVDHDFTTTREIIMNAGEKQIFQIMPNFVSKKIDYFYYKYCENPMSDRGLAIQYSGGLVYIEDDYELYNYIRFRLNYSQIEDYIKWVDQSGDGYFSFLINDTGVFTGYPLQMVIDFYSPLPQNYSEYSSFGDSLVNMTYSLKILTIMLHDDISSLNKLLYKLIIYKGVVNDFMLDINLNGFEYKEFRIVWHINVFSIYIGSSSMVQLITFYLWWINDLIYFIIYDYWDIEVKVFWDVISIEWDWMTIEIWHVESTWIHWIIAWHWSFWCWKTQWWCRYSDRVFIEYLVWVEYKSYFWYIFYVPTTELPGQITMIIQEMLYTDIEFNITFSLIDSMGNPVKNAIIGFWWNNIPNNGTLSNIETGVYKLSLPSVLVNPGNPSIKLNMTISSIGFIDTYYECLIAVDPKAVDKKTSTSTTDDGNGDDDGTEPEEILGFYILFIIIASTLTAVYLVKNTSNKKKLLAI